MTPRRVVPRDLVDASDGGGSWWVERAALAPLRSAGWLAPERLESALVAADAAHGRAPVAIVAAGAMRVVLRAVRHGGVLGSALGGGLGGPGRPFAEIAANVRLRAAGAPVPRPAFAGAWRRGLVWHGVMATHFEEDALDGDAFLHDAPSPAALARAIASAARAVRRFHDAGGSHADLHCKNLLVRERGGACETLVIDLDRARVLADVSPRARMEQLMRLYRSLLKRGLRGVVGERGAVAFLHAYVGGDRALRAALLERLPAERRRVARHALLYRSS